MYSGIDRSFSETAGSVGEKEFEGAVKEYSRRREKVEFTTGRQLSNLLVTLVPVEGNLIRVVRPGSEFHVAPLLVKRKILDVNRTRTFENCRRNPKHVTGVEDKDIRLVADFVLAIGTDNRYYYCVVTSNDS